MRMNPIIIACRTLEQELLDVMEGCNCHIPVIWLEAGGHNVPKLRRAQLEGALAQCCGFDVVLLAMSFCGNSLVGIRSGAHTLVVPKFDDCIPLLLGKSNRKTDSLYLSTGWLGGKDNLLTEYERSIHQYGQTRADRIFGAMLRHYRHLIWLADDHSPSAPATVQQFAARFGLSLVTRRKDPAMLNKLVSGHWDEDFLIVPPQTEITLKMRNRTEYDA